MTVMPADNGRAARRSSGAPLTVAAVAARLGVAASTLRTWDRRYGLGPSSHEAGSHRRYTPADVARLERMRQLTLEGVAPADAARVALHGDAQAVPATSPEEPEEPILADPLSLAAAAVEPDPDRAHRMVAHAMREGGVVQAWLALVQPALGMIGGRGGTDRPGHEPELIVSDAVLAAVRRSSTGALTAGAALLMPADGERLVGHVLAGGLAERGVAARLLRSGSDLVEQATRTVTERKVGALAVLGAAHRAEEVVRAVVAEGGVEVFLIGSDAPELLLPRVQRVRTLRAAVEEMAEALSA